MDPIFASGKPGAFAAGCRAELDMGEQFPRHNVIGPAGLFHHPRPEVSSGTQQILVFGGSVLFLTACRCTDHVA